MRIALVSDAWTPQVNGVVRTLQTTVAELRRRGHEVTPITPDLFATLPCPSYPDIRLAIGCGPAMRRRLDALDADAIHIATEGPLGWAARRWCLSHGLPFSTSFHTRFPDYLAVRTGLSAELFWPVLRRFHAPAGSILTATDTLAQELAARGLPQTRRWSRGVDLDLFSPDNAPHPALASLQRPIQLYVGRVAVEKNIGAFLDTNVSGTKVVVGDGPALKMLRQRYPDALFLGALHGALLAAAYAGADVLVFPSLTDTFGLVMVEALASGTPVAGFPVRGPIDIITGGGRGPDGRASGRIGALSENLETAIVDALTADRAACAAEGARYSWSACTDQFLAGLCLVGHEALRSAA
ncbi:glycosyltransferase family 4 protein [Sphingomonas sp. MMS24-J13]|uniref:glycosyltransferase family 4 protein n=1 Tax=Sphingomonas sp. MMS24-J13 TaxID=3238686 RepID=UPI0038515F14